MDVSKIGYFFDIPASLKLNLYTVGHLLKTQVQFLEVPNNVLILNIASTSKETVKKLKFLGQPRDKKHRRYFRRRFLS